MFYTTGSLMGGNLRKRQVSDFWGVERIFGCSKIEIFIKYFALIFFCSKQVQNIFHRILPALFRMFYFLSLSLIFSTTYFNEFFRSSSNHVDETVIFRSMSRFQFPTRVSVLIKIQTILAVK